MTPPIDPALAARIELSTPLRYHLGRPAPAVEPWWQRAFDEIGKLFSRLFSGVHVGASAQSAIGIAVLVVVLGACVLLVARLFGGRARRVRLATATALEPDRDETALARAAFLAAERGEMTAAVRLLLRASVTLLDIRGAIRYDSSATIGELRRAVRRRGERVSAPFDAIATAYVDGVYAERAIDATVWQGARGAYESLRATRA